MAFNENEIRKELCGIKMDMTEISMSVKHIKEKVDENTEVIKGIHSLASIVDRLSLTIDNLIHTHSSDITGLQNSIKRTCERLEVLEKAPVQKWNKLVGIIAATVVTAIVAYLMGKFL
jgi:hypothetical protein